jgi:HEAT repeat protein
VCRAEEASAQAFLRNEVRSILAEAEQRYTYTPEKSRRLAALGPEAMPFILEELAARPRNSWSARCARDAITCLGTDAIASLRHFLHSGNPIALRRVAIEMAGATPKTDEQAHHWAKATLQEALLVPELRMEALLALAYIDNGDTAVCLALAEELIRVSATESCFHVYYPETMCSRIRAALLAMRPLRPEAINLLVDGVATAEAEVGAVCLAVLRACGEEASPVYGELRALMSKGLPAESPLCLAFVARIGQVESIPTLIAALFHDQHEMRVMASDLLVALGDEAVPAVAALIDADSYVPARTLARFGPAGARALLDAARSDNPRIRQNAVFGLGLISDAGPDVVSFMQFALDDPDVTVSVTAARMLAAIDGAAAVPHLERLISRLSGEQNAILLIRDLLFECTVLNVQSEDFPDWELVREPSEEVYPAKFYIALDQDSQRFYLADLTGQYCGFEKTSLHLRWVKPEELLELTWETIPQGSNDNIADGILLLARRDGAWVELFRNYGEGFAGSCGSASDGDYSFAFSPYLNELRFRIDRMRTEYGIGIVGVPGSLYNESLSPDIEPYGFITTNRAFWEWPCTLPEGLTIGSGTRWLNAGDWQYPLESLEGISEQKGPWPDSPLLTQGTALPPADLRLLNPELRDRQYWTGKIVVHRALPPYEPQLIPLCSYSTML